MVAAAAVQQREQSAATRSRNRSGKHVVDSHPRSSRANGNGNRGGEARNSGEHSRDARDVIDERRREREEDERRRKGKQPRADPDHSRHDNQRRAPSPQRSSPQFSPPRRPTPPRSPPRRGPQRWAPRRRSPTPAGYDSVGIDGIRAYTARLRQVNWPSSFSPKGIKPYNGERDPEAWLRQRAAVRMP